MEREELTQKLAAAVKAGDLRKENRAGMPAIVASEGALALLDAAGINHTKLDNTDTAPKGAYHLVSTADLTRTVTVAGLFSEVFKGR